MQSQPLEPHVWIKKSVKKKAGKNILNLGAMVPSILGHRPEITVTINLFKEDLKKMMIVSARQFRERIKSCLHTCQWQCWIFEESPCDHSLAGLPSYPADLKWTHCQSIISKFESAHLSWSWARQGGGGGWGWRRGWGRGWPSPPPSSSQRRWRYQRRGQYPLVLPSLTVFEI